MKRFRFEQDNSFGDTLVLDLNASDINEAREIVREFIKDNTSSMSEVFKEEVQYMKEMVEEQIERCKRFHESEIDEMPELALNHKYWVCGKKQVSIQDYLNNPEQFLNDFGLDASKNTYIWTFDNCEYFLEEINTEIKGVQFSQFVYTGK